MRRKIMYYVIAMVLCFMLTGCNGDEVKDKVEKTVQEEDEHVLSVKGGHPNAYPDKTYEEAFENFFASPTWRYFVGTKDGPDDDGDGKPDYTEDGIDIVEFTGDCTYMDVEVKALLQFTLDKEDDTFTATYLSFNDVPQNNLTLMALLEAVFTDEEEELAAGSGETNMTDPLAAAYVGTWWDLENPRFGVSIESIDEESYFIEVNLGYSTMAMKILHGEYVGVFDSETGIVECVGNMYDEYYPEDGEMQSVPVYTDGIGIFYIGDDGLLYWQDYEDGSEYVFKKE